ncbi:MAG: DUF2520 domain-containing protein [Rikenellaceae bacterium]|nr:DUF2520 domain-containing protein [Rikenellaceae bacterium]
MALKIVLIGSGNVAESMAQAIVACPKLKLLQLYARNAERAEAIARIAGCTYTSDEKWFNRSADLYLIAVSDRAVEEVATTLPVPPKAIVAHTAGSVSLEALKKYPRRGIFYPFQGFSVGRKIDFRQVPLFLEAADEEVMATLKEAASALSEQVFEADSERRKRIHLAGVICNNFVNELYASAADLMAAEGLPYAVLKPLIEETAAKAVATTHPALVQTGPAKRGDTQTQEGHLALLEEDETLHRIYELMSQKIWETSKKI